MLSFINNETCQQLAAGAVRNACELAAENPMMTLGVAAVGTLLTAASTGVYFFNRRKPAPVVAAPQVPVARLTRQPVNQVINQVVVDASKLAVPAVNADLGQPVKMPTETIVLAYLFKQSQTQLAARQLRDIRRTEKPEVDVDRLVLKALGLPEDGSMPKTPEGQAHYDAVVTALELPQCKLR